MLHAQRPLTRVYSACQSPQALSGSARTAPKRGRNLKQTRAGDGTDASKQRGSHRAAPPQRNATPRQTPARRAAACGQPAASRQLCSTPQHACAQPAALRVVAAQHAAAQPRSPGAPPHTPVHLCSAVARLLVRCAEQAALQRVEPAHQLERGVGFPGVSGNGREWGSQAASVSAQEWKGMWTRRQASVAAGLWPMLKHCCMQTATCIRAGMRCSKPAAALLLARAAACCCSRAPDERDAV